MKYAGIIYDDFVNGENVCVSLWMQGCHFHCKGCHNQQTWDFNGGLEFYPDLIPEIIDALTAQGINRNFCIMGGEPLCPENEFLTMLLIIEVRKHLPDVPIYIWTGYTLEQLMHKGDRIRQILKSINYLIDGPYIEAQRDTTLPMRGSSNQRIIDMKTVDFSEKI